MAKGSGQTLLWF